MEEYVSLTISGATVRVPAGTTVLDAAMQYGICIPHLCHVPELTAVGACRLCIVEVMGEDGGSKVTTSCTLDVEDGMVIETDTPKLRRLRRNIAELLVAEAPNSRAVQDLAVRCGVEQVRYPFRNNDCVLCGRCVRVCSELWQADAIGFVGRGEDRRVDWPFGAKPDFCKDCNTCITLCPMTITPCGGPMEVGAEELCGLCASQLSMAEGMNDTCVGCTLGDGFGCIRKGGAWSAATPAAAAAR